MKTKIYIFLLISFILANFLLLSSCVKKENFVDKTGKFSSIQAEVEQRLDEFYKKSDHRFFIYAYREDDITQNIWGEDLLDDFGISSGTDAVILTLKLEMGEWYCDIYTYGEANESISDSEVDALLMDGGIFDRIKTQDPIQGVLDYVEFVGNAVPHNLIPYSRQILVPLFWGLVGALVAFLCVFIPYKRKVRSDCYPLKEFTNLDLTYSRDDFAGSFVSRRHVPRSSSSSGGSGSRGGGRGGGGGHRGGR